MGLDVVDTVKSTFGSLNTDTGLKVIGLLFVIQLANILSTTLYQAGTAASFLGGVLAVTSIIAALLVIVGALRSLESESFKREQYLDNMLWPVSRLIGANLATTVFAYGIAILVALPVVALATLTGVGLTTAGSLLGLVLTTSALFVGLAAFVYILLTLIVSLPMIASGDRRMFEALDISIRRTHGNKNSMFVAFVPVMVLYLIAVTITTMAPSQGSTFDLAAGVGAALLSSVVAASFLSLLTEYNQRLPEE